MTINKTDKQKLVSNASELFATQGYHFTSIADIATTCNLSKGSLYHYIDSKLDLGQSVIQSAHDAFKAQFFAISMDVTKTPSERFEELLVSVYDHFIETPASILLMGITHEVVSSVPAFKSALKAFFADWIEAFKMLLVDIIGDDRSEVTATRMLCELQGAVLFYRLYDDASALNIWKKESQQLLVAEAVA